MLNPLRAVAIAMSVSLSCSAHCEPPPSGAYGVCIPTADGIGSTYFGREIAQVMGHSAVDWLERDGRAGEERTDLLARALEVKRGEVVADIGSGSGYFSIPLAHAVEPNGRVFAVDVQKEMVEFLTARAKQDGVDNITTILGRIDDVSLAAASVDLALLVDAYHEFEKPWEMMRSIVRALRPGGRLALVEFRAEDERVEIKPLHKMSQGQARREIEAAGLIFDRTDSSLPKQHLMWFHRPTGVIEPFNGVSLDGWNGDRSYWSVEDGCIVGRSTQEHPLTTSTYLAWDGDMPQDFELRCRVKLNGGNSGIHYRSSRIAGQADMHGFQADLDAQNSYSGVLYEGLGRELMSARGEQVEFTPSGKRVIAQFAPDTVLRKTIRAGEWNDYRIEANGTRVRHWINNVLMSDVTDGDASRFRRDGLLAFQLHQGAPMEVRYCALEVRAIQSAPPVSSLTLPAGFTAELLASAQPSQGSWVALTFDSHGRAVISPQDGELSIASIPGLTRTSDGTLWTGETTLVQQFHAPIRSAQGLCFVGDELYANALGSGGQSALWRVRDLDHDGDYEDALAVIPYSGDAGEHGPHAVVRGPDGALYVALGNHTRVPESLAHYSNDETPGRAMGSPHDFFGEDRIDARMWDPRGHAVGVYSPGGVVVRVDPSDHSATVFAGGFRNAYDHCFNEDGELFTYDSDMEWDIGAPWYRAPRVVHVVSGGDFGWRSGSAAMPDWYPDTLPPACETDSSSPTGMIAGCDGGFPAPWKDMIFCADWTYGRILAATLTPSGSSYTAQWQPFITGRPMPVADLAWGADGAMYFVTGGRGTQSGLYRVRANASTIAAVDATATDSAAEQLRALRRSYESLQHLLSNSQLEQGLPTLLAGLGHSDRFVRSAARTALEHQPTDSWRGAIATLNSPRARLSAALALVRAGNLEDSKSACDLAATTMAELLPQVASDASNDDAIAAMRVVEIAVARHRELAAHPSVLRVAELGLQRVAQRNHGTPIADGPATFIALELGSALGLPATVPLALAALERAPSRSEALRFAANLRVLKDGWTDDLRARYWQWLVGANDRAGGFSLRGFIENIVRDARTNVGESTRAAGGEGKSTTDAVTPATFTTTSSTLHDWRVGEFESAFDAAATLPHESADLARGAQVFRESTCILCHRFAGDGATTGPDLTGVGGRFSRRDLLTAILDPSATVSDQYRDSLIESTDGSITVGRIVSDTGDAIEVRTSPLSEERTRLLKREVASISAIGTSSMPSGLLNSRSHEEILALITYLESQIPTSP